MNRIYVIMKSLIALIVKMNPPFDASYLIFLKYKIVNAIMAYCNINQFKTNEE